MLKNNKRFFAVLFLLLFISACGGRLPATKTAEHALNRYFHRYGHKFKTSDFGKSKIEGVQVLNIEEVHKGMAAVTATVKLSDGPPYDTRSLFEKKTFRWKIISWEKM